MHQSPIVVLWHPSRHRAAEGADFLQHLLQLKSVRIEKTADREQTREIVADLADTPGLLVAAGGDGTVRSVVDAMMRCQSQRTLAVLPLGTGNDLARGLEIPLQGEAAVALLRNGKPRPLDLLHVRSAEQEIWCDNMVTSGNTGRFLETLTDELKARWGVLCYLHGVVDVVQNLKAFDVSISLDDQPAETLTALNLFIANGRTSGGGLVVSAEAKLDDGLADVLIVRDGDPGAIANLTANYFLADYRGHELIVWRQARKIRVETTPAVLSTADGDAIGSTPLEIEVVRHALQVIAP